MSLSLGKWRLSWSGTSTSFPPPFLTPNYGVTSQLRRAAISVPSNIAEGAARTSKKEFLHFLSLARGSLSEIDTQVTIAKRLGLISDDAQVQEKLDRVFGLIGGLMRSLERRAVRGSPA